MSAPWALARATAQTAGPGGATAVGARDGSVVVGDAGGPRARHRLASAPIVALATTGTTTVAVDQRGRVGWWGPRGARALPAALPPGAAAAVALDAPGRAAVVVGHHPREGLVLVHLEDGHDRARHCAAQPGPGPVAVAWDRGGWWLRTPAWPRARWRPGSAPEPDDNGPELSIPAPPGPGWGPPPGAPPVHSWLGPGGARGTATGADPVVLAMGGRPVATLPLRPEALSVWTGPGGHHLALADHRALWRVELATGAVHRRPGGAWGLWHSPGGQLLVAEAGRTVQLARLGAPGPPVVHHHSRPLDPGTAVLGLTDGGAVLVDTPGAGPQWWSPAGPPRPLARTTGPERLRLHALLGLSPGGDWALATATGGVLVWPVAGGPAWRLPGARWAAISPGPAPVAAAVVDGALHRWSLAAPPSSGAPPAVPPAAAAPVPLGRLDPLPLCGPPPVRRLVLGPGGHRALVLLGAGHALAVDGAALALAP